MFLRIVCGFAFFFSFQVFAQEAFFKAEVLPKDLCKVRVNPSEVSFQQDGMYCLVQNYPIKIQALQFENGEYSAIVPAGFIEDIFGVWVCSYCGKGNSRFENVCAHCRRPRRDPPSRAP